jgi:hypothetical protein
MANAEPPALGSLHPLVGCTIARAFQLPQAVVLATSFLKFHPGSEFAVVLLDGTNEQVSLANVKLLSVGDLGLEKGDEWRLPMLYSAEDLASVLKPALLLALLKSGAAVVAFFEVATVIFDSLPDILRQVQGHRIVATEAVRSDQRDLGRSFIAVGRGAEASLRSWSDHLQEQGFTTQTSTSDEAESTVEVSFDSVSAHVISCTGFPVGYWNLNPETFSWKDDHYEVGGEPLRSFDFRGYDPSKPHLLSKYQGPEPRILLSEHALVAQFFQEYQRKVVQAGYDMRKRPFYRFDHLSSGLRIDHRMHNIYRESYKKHRLGLEPEPPSPFGPRGGEGFLEWLNEPLRPGRKPVSRYMLAVYNERQDIHEAFPDPTGSDAGGFGDWYLRYGQRELDLPAAMAPFDARAKGDAKGAAAASLSATPVNVAGYFRAELGLGTAARSLLAALEAAEIPFNTSLFEGTANRQTHPFAQRRADTGSPDINIICVNADKIASLANTAPELWHGRYTIGVWFWEVEDFPAWAHGAFDYVDEVWVASEFMHETFRKVSPKAVFKFKLPVLKPEIDPSLSRTDLGLPDRFVFLFSFDFFSVLERKNPLGLIEAYTKAFKPEEGAVLVIKTINGDKRILEMEKLRYAARGRPDIILRDGYLSAIQNNSLTALADCYVSLHRSEGFGLTIAEAMALGKPAIATAYSGNLEFMTEENSYLCPARRVGVGPEHEPYPASSHWSEPDLEAAARLLRHVYTNQEEARERGLRAAEHIRRSHEPAMSGSVIRDRLAKIRGRRAATHSPPSSALLADRLEELEAENAQLRGRVTT